MKLGEQNIHFQIHGGLYRNPAKTGLGVQRYEGLPAVNDLLSHLRSLGSWQEAQEVRLCCVPSHTGQNIDPKA